MRRSTFDLPGEPPSGRTCGGHVIPCVLATCGTNMCGPVWALRDSTWHAVAETLPFAENFIQFHSVNAVLEWQGMGGVSP
jgi:hypothetical protein